MLSLLSFMCVYPLGLAQLFTLCCFNRKKCLYIILDLTFDRNTLVRHSLADGICLGWGVVKHSCIHSCIHSFMHSFIHSFIQSINHSFHLSLCYPSQTLHLSWLHLFIASCCSVHLSWAQELAFTGSSVRDSKKREGVRGDRLHWRVQGSTSSPTGISSRPRDTIRH